MFRDKAKRILHKTALTLVVICVIMVSLAHSALQATRTLNNYGSVTHPPQESFFTSFESGDPYSEVIVETSPPPSYPGYTPGVVTGSQEQAHTGTWSVKCYSQDGGPAGRCRLNVNVNATKLLYARIYIYIASWSGYIQVLRFWSDAPEDLDSSGSGDYVAYLEITSGEIRRQLGRHSGPDVTRPSDYKASPYSFQTGRWYGLEMMYRINPVNGEFHAWVDGQEITGLAYHGDTESGGWCKWITQLKSGVVLYQTNVSPATVFVDDLFVSRGPLITIIGRLG